MWWVRKTNTSLGVAQTHSDHGFLLFECGVFWWKLGQAVAFYWDWKSWYFLFQISTNHLLLHQSVLDLLIRLFETTHEDLDVLVQVGCLDKLESFFAQRKTTHFGYKVATGVIVLNVWKSLSSSKHTSGGRVELPALPLSNSWNVFVLSLNNIFIARAEEDPVGPHGSLTQSRLHITSCLIHHKLLGDTGYRHITHPTLCHRGWLGLFWLNVCWSWPKSDYFHLEVLGTRQISLR